METFTITADDGRKLRVQGDAPPTDEEIDDLFKQWGDVEPDGPINPSGEQPWQPQARASLPFEYEPTQDLSVPPMLGRDALHERPDQFNPINDPLVQMREPDPMKAGLMAAGERATAELPFNLFRDGASEMEAGIVLPQSLKLQRAISPYRWVRGKIPGEESDLEGYKGERIQSPNPVDAAVRGGEVALDQLARGFVEFATSPKGVLELGAMGIPVVGEAVLMKFFADMVHGGAVEVKDALNAIGQGDVQGAVQHVVGALAQGKFAKDIGKHGINKAQATANKFRYETPEGQAWMAEHKAEISKARQAAALHSELLDIKSKSANYGGQELADGGGIMLDSQMQTRANEIRTELERLGVDRNGLTPEMSKLIEDAAGQEGKPVDVIWGKGKDGRRAGISADGERLEIYPENFIEGLARALPHQKEAIAKSVFGEEEIHSYTTPAEADAAAADMKRSPGGIAEKIANRVYERDGTVTDRAMGYEYLRYQMQLLKNLTPTELIEGSASSRLSNKALLILDRAMNKARDKVHKFATGKDSPIKSAVDNISKRIEAAKQGFGEAPRGVELDPSNAPFSKLRTTPEEVAKMTDAEFRAAVPTWRDYGGMQVQAELLASTTHKDPAYWKSELAKLDPQLVALRDKAKMGDMAAMNEWGGLAAKRQFFSEGLQVAEGTSQLSQKAKSMLEESPASKLRDEDVMADHTGTIRGRMQFHDKETGGQYTVPEGATVEEIIAKRDAKRAEFADSGPASKLRNEEPTPTKNSLRVLEDEMQRLDKVQFDLGLNNKRTSEEVVKPLADALAYAEKLVAAIKADNANFFKDFGGTVVRMDIKKQAQEQGVLLKRAQDTLDWLKQWKESYDKMPPGQDTPASKLRDRPEMLRKFNDAVQEIKAGGTRPLGMRNVTAPEKSFMVGWSNGSERWDVGRIGSYNRTAVGEPSDWNNPESVRQWREKYGSLLEKNYASSGEEIKLDSNQILIPANSLAEAKLIAQHLPEPPFAVNATERNPLLNLPSGATPEQVRAALEEVANQEPNKIDVVKSTSDFLDNLGPASKLKRSQDFEKLRKMKLAAQGIKAEQFSTPTPAVQPPSPERPAVTELPAGQEFIPTPERIRARALETLNSDNPSFESFRKQSGYGASLSPQSATEAWLESVGQWLQNATGKELEAMVDKLKLRTEVIPSALRKKGVGLNISDSNIGDTPGIEAWRAKQLERATQLDKNVARIEQEIDALTRQVVFNKTAPIKGEPLFSAEEMAKSSLTAEEVQIQKLEQRAEMYRRESARITAEARPSPTKIVRKKLVDVYETPDAPQPEATGVQSEFHSLFPSAGTPLPEQSAQSLATGPQKARTRIMDAIFKALEPEKGGLELTRKNIGLDEIDWNRGSDAIRHVTAQSIRDPEQIGLEMTEGAGSNRTTKETIGGGRKLAHREAAPESHTKAVVALLNPFNGNVELVSTYRDGRRGPVLYDPGVIGDRQMTYSDALKKYKVLQGYLIDAPVKNFHKRFKSVEEFNQQFHNAAKERSDQYRQEPLGLDPNLEFYAQGTQGLEGEGSFVMGPAATETRLVNGMIKGALEIGAELTEPEARAAYNAFRVLETPADAKLLIDRLHERAEQNQKVREARMREQEIAGKKGKGIWAKEEGGMLTRIKAREAEKLAANPEYKTKEVTKRTIAKLEKELEDLAKVQGGLTQQDWLLINAMRKVEEVGTSPTGVLSQKGFETVNSAEWTINELYELAKRNESETSAVRSAKTRYGKEAQVPVPAQAAEGGRELTMRSWGKRNIEAQPFQQHPPVSQQPPKLGRAARAHVARTEYINPEIRSLSAEASKHFDPSEWVNYYESLLGAEGDAPASRLRRNATEKAADVVRGFGAMYDEPMADRIARAGGPNAGQFGRVGREIIDRTKEVQGLQARKLDEALAAAAGTRLTAKGIQVPDATRMKSAAWLNGRRNVTADAAISRTVDAMEAWVNRASHPREWSTLPVGVKQLIDLGGQVNLRAGQLIQAVTPGFIANGKFERHLTPLGMDVVINGGGTFGGAKSSAMWNKMVRGTAEANYPYVQVETTPGSGVFRPATSAKEILKQVKQDFRALREELIKPVPDVAHLDKLNQDFTRKYPKAITHIKTATGWHPILHSSLYNYLQTVTHRAASSVAFREQFPPNMVGRGKLAKGMDSAKQELPKDKHEDVDDLVRTLQGHATDDFGNRHFGALSPGRPAGRALAAWRDTAGRVLTQAALTGQMLTQLPETAMGATPQFLGYKNYLRGIAKANQMYAEMEKTGEVNKAMRDYSWDSSQPIRSAARITGNVIGQLTANQFLNEVQERWAAATARVVSDRITSGNLTTWEKRMLPETFRKMGFDQAQAQAMISGDPVLLGEFRRKAAGWLTSGNKAQAEGSSLGANRLFNTVFRFQSYPMMKAQQARQTFGRLIEATQENTPASERKAAIEHAAKFLAGNIGQGAAAAMLASLFFQGGPSGVAIKYNEAKDDPLGFLGEALAATLSGPTYLIWRSSTNRGGSLTDNAARLIFPYNTTREMYDAIMGNGYYRNMDLSDRMGKFAMSRTPAAKMLKHGASLLGLSKRDVRLDAAISAASRWKREQPGGDDDFKQGALTEEQTAFREHISKALEAMKSDDAGKYQDELALASESGAKGVESVKRSLEGKKILKMPGGAPMTADDKDNLRDRIGEEAYDRIEQWDAWLDAAIDSL
jgi:hypothetical protein